MFSRRKLLSWLPVALVAPVVADKITTVADPVVERIPYVRDKDKLIVHDLRGLYYDHDVDRQYVWKEDDFPGIDNPSDIVYSLSYRKYTKIQRYVIGLPGDIPGRLIKG